MSRRPLVLATWNVHGFVGADGARDPGRTLALLTELDADVIALQEVAGADWAGPLEAAGYALVQGITETRESHGPFGNALASRLPLLRVRELDLSLPGRERRGALDACVAAPGGQLRVVCTHLGLRRSERRLQAERLAGHLAQAAEPRVLLGDLNDWTRSGRQVRALGRVVGPLSRVRTFPSGRPLLPLDRAAAAAPGWRLHVSAVRDARARAASDHLPLRAELEPYQPSLP